MKFSDGQKEKLLREIMNLGETPADFALTNVDALVDISGIPIAELNGLSNEQLESLLDEEGVDLFVLKNPGDTSEVMRRNLEILRRKIAQWR